MELDHAQARLRSALYALGAVQEEEFLDDGRARMQIRLPRRDWERLLAQEAR